MYRKYYSYSDMPQLIKHEPEKPKKPEPAPKPRQQQQSGGLPFADGMIEDGKLFGKFELDDIILAIVVFALLMDECNDNMLLIALGFIFLTGIT